MEENVLVVHQVPSPRGTAYLHQEPISIVLQSALPDYRRDVLSHLVPPDAQSL